MFSDFSEIMQKVNNKRKLEKVLLEIKPYYSKEKIKMDNEKYYELTDNENMTYKICGK